MSKEAENAPASIPSYSEPTPHVDEAVDSALENSPIVAPAVESVSRPKTSRKPRTAAPASPPAPEPEPPAIAEAAAEEKLVEAVAETEEAEEKPREGRLGSLRKPLLGLTRGRAAPKQPVAEITPSRPVLVEFRDVIKSYDKHLALDNVSLKLYKGEFLSLVGPSGAGKSTLIKCLTLQEWPEKGRIIVAGRDITLLRTRELPYYRRNVGIVFQDFKLLPSKTVYENIAFALEVSNTSAKEIRQRVGIILDTVGMGHKRDSFSNELSGGEQQRVAIARALVHDPKILIADEPTGTLDPVNTWEIIELLYKINKSGTMVVLATHDREIVDALKKRVITMRAGKVVSDQEKGTYLV